MNKIIMLTAFSLLISLYGFSQDTTHKIIARKSTSHHFSHSGLKKQTSQSNPNIHGTSAKIPMYRDTRLGSSSKKYNTYKKNDNGAGVITTNPNK